jgi:tRNA G46 methylase TrmB
MSADVTAGATQAAAEKVVRSINFDSGFIDFSHLFALEPSSHSSGDDLMGQTLSHRKKLYDSDDSSNDGDDDSDGGVLIESMTSDVSIPVKLEIGSGSGEWVVAQASADLYHSHSAGSSDGSTSKHTSACPLPSPRALWLSLELRCDRVYDTLCRSVVQNLTEGVQYEQMWKHQQYVQQQKFPFKGSSGKTQTPSDHADAAGSSGGDDGLLQFSSFIPSSLGDRPSSGSTSSTAPAGSASATSTVPDFLPIASAHFAGLRNLAILGGDATKVLPDRITPDSLTSIFINHPEPPERTSGEGESQGMHLLTQRFFGEMHRVLKPEGTVTIVTDNLPYGKSLMAAVAKSAAEALRLKEKHEKGEMKTNGDNSNKQGSVKSAEAEVKKVVYHPAFVSVFLEADDSIPRTLQDSVDVVGASTTENKSATTTGDSKKAKDGQAVLTSLGNKQANGHGATRPTAAAAAASVGKKSQGKKRYDSNDTGSDSDSDDSDDDGANDGTVAFAYDNDGEFGSAISGSVKNKAATPTAAAAKGKQAYGEGAAGQQRASASGSRSSSSGSGSNGSGSGSGSGSGNHVVQLWRGSCTDIHGHGGHSVEASSYFDRLWERGQKKRRWFLVLKKLEL